MPKSARNVKSKTPRASIDAIDWDTKLSNLKLNNDDWNMSLSIISPSVLIESEIISILTVGVINGQRQRFTVITYEDVLDQIAAQCKNKNTKDAPEFYEVCILAKNYLESVGELDSQILSKVLKFIFNNLRVEDLKQQSAKKNSVTKPNRPEESKKKENPKDKKAGTKNIKQSEPPVAKEKSKLYKRGEEIPEEKYLGDEPDNGISRYILLVNFEKLGLLEELCRLHIDIHSIIRLHVNDQKQLQILITKQKAEKMWGSKGYEQDLEQMRTEQEALLLAEERLRQYWRTTSILMRDHVYDLLGNIATLDYNVKTELLPDDLNGTENRASFGTAMFNEIATILYDLIDFRRQWQNYLQHIKVIQLPICPPLLDENSPPSQNQTLRISKPALSLIPESTDKIILKSEECGDISSGEDYVDMRFYSEVLQGLPVESTSVELILHAVLEQVAATENGILPRKISIDEKARTEGIDPNIARNIANEVDKLLLTDAERTMLSEEIPLHKNLIKSPLSTSPTIIMHPYDENQYKQLFASGKVNNCDELMKCELDLFTRLFPNVFCQTSGEKCGEITSELQGPDKDHLEEDQAIEENLKKMKDVRFCQILRFAEKYGFTEEEFKHYFNKLQLEGLDVWRVYSAGKKFRQSLEVMQPLGLSCGTLAENPVNNVLVQSFGDDCNKDKNNDDQITPRVIPLDDPYLLYESLSNLFIKIEYEISQLSKSSTEKEGGQEQQSSSTASFSVNSSMSSLFPKRRSRSVSSASSSVNQRSPTSSRQSNSTRTKSESRKSQTSAETGTESKSTTGRRSSSAVHFDLPSANSKGINCENREKKNRFSKLTLFAQELQELLKQLQDNNQIIMVSGNEKEKFSPIDSCATCTVISENFGTLVEEARNIHLNEWCIEERLSPHILLQRLHFLNYERPHLDVYKRRHDESLLIVSHHPFDRSIRSNHHTWSSWFHVNGIGFRPYLQLIESHIRNWTREQEALYEAAKLSAEILQDDTRIDTPVGEIQSKTEKKTSPKSKKVNKSKRTRSTSGSESDASITPGDAKSLLGDPNEFIFPGSLKALQREQELIKLKKETEERQKEEKRIKSAKKRTEKEATQTQKKESSGKRNKSPSPKSPIQKSNTDDDTNQVEHLKPRQSDSEFWPFIGYDISNILPHLTGEVTHMFPTDGGTIKTQRSEIPTGGSNLRVSLMKDGHVFTIHKADGPPEPNIPYKKSNETDFVGEENESAANQFKSNDIIQEDCHDHDATKNPVLPELFSSVTACFSDGICLAVCRMNNMASNSQTQLDHINLQCKTNNINNNSNIPVNSIPVNINNKVGPIHIEECGENIQTNQFKQFIHLSTPDGAQISVYHDVSEDSDPVAEESKKEGKEVGNTQDDECTVNDEQNNSSSKSFHGTLLKLLSSINSNPNTINSDGTYMNSSKMKSDKEYELTRFITSDGIVIQVLMPGCTSSASTALKILYPDGAIMERGTAVAEELRRTENPNFSHDEQEINIHTETVIPNALQVNPVHPQKASARKKSAKKKVEEKKPEDDVPALAATENAMFVTPSTTSRSTTDDPDEDLPWLVTLLSGERFWFKLAKSCQRNEKSVEDTPTTNTSAFRSQESVTLDTPSSKRSADTIKYEIIPSKSMESFRAYDPATGETLYTRPEDGMIAVEPHPDSPFKLIIQHSDGTRITQLLLICDNEKMTDRSNNEFLHSNLNKPQIFIRVECVGFPAVVLNKSTGEFEISLFGKSQFSSTFHSNPRGYHLLHQSQEIIELNEPTVYEMHYNDNESLLDCVDPHKNVYTVDNWANCNVLLTVSGKRHPLEELDFEPNQVNSTELTSDQSEQQVQDPLKLNSSGKENVNSDRMNESKTEESTDRSRCLHDEHIPRLFYYNPEKHIVSELLHFKEFDCLLQKAYGIQAPHHNVAALSIQEKLAYMNMKKQKLVSSDIKSSNEALFLKEALQSNPKIYGLILMQPLTTSDMSKYYVQENIIPEGLSSHDFQLLTRPSNLIVNSDLPKFGERAGKGLDIIQPTLEHLGLKIPETNVTLLPLQKSKTLNRQSRKLINSHQSLHMNVRQFTQYPMITPDITQRILGVLCAYTEHYLNRLSQWCKQQPLRLSEVMQPECELFFSSTSTVTDGLSGDKQTANQLESENAADVSTSPIQQTVINQEIRQPTFHISPARQAAFEALRQELEKAMRDRAALRSTHIPNYFRSKEGIGFLLSQVPDVKKLAKFVPELNNPNQNVTKTEKSTLTEQSIPTYDSPPKIASPLLRTLETDKMTEIETVGKTHKSNTDRLVMSKANITDERNNFSKQIMNTVPDADIKTAVTRTSKRNCFYYYDTDPTEIELYNHQTSQVPLDSVALARRKRIRVPNILYAKRPSLNKFTYNSDINIQQALVEDPVRRRVLFTSIIGGPPYGQISLRRMRGIRLTPNRINVGTLQCGSTRNFSVKLVNWGPETAHFRIKQLPIHSGIRVFYAPGPIPAGLSRQVVIEVSNQIQRHLEGNSSDQNYDHNSDQNEATEFKKTTQSYIRWSFSEKSYQSSEDNENNDDVSNGNANKGANSNTRVQIFSERLQITTDTHIMYLLITGRRVKIMNSEESSIINVNEEAIKPQLIPLLRS
ncbi:unnamed protein product [Trichobilharzia szidati]|nr:unnamed protein product [Trichobilharzia szidati]